MRPCEISRGFHIWKHIVCAVVSGVLHLTMPDQHASAPDNSNSQAVADGVDVGSGTALVATPEFARGRRVGASGRPAILDFMTNTIAGYDATHQNPAPDRALQGAQALPQVASVSSTSSSHKLKTCAYLGDISSALNARQRAYPDILSVELSNQAEQITRAAVAYKKIIDESFDSTNFVERMSRSESASEILRQSVKAVARDVLEDVLVVTNIELEGHGLKVARVAANGEIWMGNLGENNRYSPAMRLSR